MYFTYIEEYIFNLYKLLSIDSWDQLSVEQIAKELGVEVNYSNFSMSYNETIFLTKSTEEREWQQFGHEMCHYLRHSGNQTSMHPLFIELQEYQADYFAYHFCVPTFMLENLYNCSIHNIMRLFNVEYEFSRRRLEIHKSKQNEWSII
ncbi:terminase [Virgibacillus indicus]|uniref:Terminase n=1 Tax=Virgibacillus indicus TaxID=2024554 RepID=A0A265NA23_9BACI|nr:ImmA/IrrE family metallo-endopeptidase [Virgibacillus indicus]OZU88677.1 terminase [Virgibacillus indicus]